MKKLRIYMDCPSLAVVLTLNLRNGQTDCSGISMSEHFCLWFLIIVDAEMRNAPPEVAEKHAELLGLEPERIKLSDESIDLAGVYIQENIVSQNYRDDALHIALATIAQVDILVSWNFKHIVNYGKIRQFNGVNMRQGYNSIQIYSPREVTSYGD